MTHSALQITEATISVYPYILKLSRREDLTFDEMYDAFDAVLNGSASDGEVASLLMALKEKGETIDEITALVTVLKDHASKLPRHVPGVIDNCGTGGDGSNSFNISTTSAFVIAGAGVKIAKHGNKSITSLTGSSDVLSALGLKLDYFPGKVAAQLDDAGIAFLFAPFVHPKIKQIMKVRNDLKVPTIFNMIGPLINPVDLDYQYLGIYKRDQVETMAHVLKSLGRKRAVVVNGAHAMDEANLSGENRIAILRDGKVTTHILKPEDVGLPAYEMTELRGGDGHVNREILTDVLQDEATDAQRDTVLLNAGIGIFTAEKAESIKAGIEVARESIESGNAAGKLQELIKYTNEGVK
ncbi:anthranilate phosphoribosyltransferase [Lacicoccus alkaliphilus]|uniref:Anthranilate phosphoribosyltransferase n=1 Tax=Lacicoccus alkaliphilus DSM 16010 TaxID=1123231 RepID=A0A1M7FM05_9BACL|nr:anthranilate phosphoribosyltransferase [Salinicoccus alkaliphilus]SHM04778.1 anthranilate phosphoribosyltransferase [Salinicoccus alkaliphilus DSM 16010]